MDRVDALIRELSARHANDDERFLTQVRPMVERILDPAMPDEKRVPLLELLAESFERDVQVRRDLQQARENWARFFEALKQMIRRRD